MENYFLLLGLPFNPAENNENVIIGRIDEKKKFWTENANHFENGGLYRRYLQMVPEIRKVMLDTELRQQEAQKAIKIVYEELDQYFKMIVTGKTVTEREIELIEKKTGFDKRIIFEQMKYYGYCIDTSEKQWMGIYQEEYLKKPEQAERFQMMDNKLKIFGARNFYEFLEIERKNRYMFSEAILLDKSRNLKETRFQKNDSESGIGRQICTFCQLAFQSKESRKQYDDYLKWTEKRQILEQVKEIAELKNYVLKEEQSELFITQLEDVLKDRERAIQIFIAFCEVEHILYGFGDNEQGKVQEKNWNVEKNEKTVEDYQQEKNENIKIYKNLIIFETGILLSLLILLLQILC